MSLSLCHCCDIVTLLSLCCHCHVVVMMMLLTWRQLHDIDFIFCEKVDCYVVISTLLSFFFCFYHVVAIVLSCCYRVVVIVTWSLSWCCWNDFDFMTLTSLCHDKVDCCVVIAVVSLSLFNFHYVVVVVSSYCCRDHVIFIWLSSWCCQHDVDFMTWSWGWLLLDHSC